MSAASLPMEQRTFGLHGQVEHVLFCHIVDGRIATYAGFGPKPARGRDFLEQIIAGRWVRPDAEQFFLRISSNRPIAEIQDSDPVALLVSEVRAAASGQVAKKRDI